MTTKEKTVLFELIGNGKIQDVIEVLSSINLSESKRKEFIAIASRYKRFQSQNRLGTLSFEQASVTENQVVGQLVDFINSFNDESLSPEKSNTSLVTTKLKNEKKPLGYKIGIIGSVASIMGLMLYFLPLQDKPAPQLTVFVTDTKGNVALEHEGELNTSVGNRPMREVIGQHGRTNFGDILPEYLGDSITIGFKSEGWELVNPNNTFVFDGNPIHLNIKKDNSLGIIKGVVKTRNGQNFIKGAKILVNTDTTVFTNANGIFYVLLPESMRVKKVTDAYTLTVTKAGYKTKSEHFYPKSSDAEIRLEKNK